MQVLQWMMSKGGKGGKGGKGWKPKHDALKKFTSEQKVWVGGLTPDVDRKKLEEHFSTIAKTKWVEVLHNKTACVVFETAEEATSAIAALNGSVVGSATLECDVWTQKERTVREELTAEKKALVDKVKTFQKSSPENKQSWYSYCESQPMGKYDPALHDEIVLQTFLASVGVA